MTMKTRFPPHGGSQRTDAFGHDAKKISNTDSISTPPDAGSARPPAGHGRQDVNDRTSAPSRTPSRPADPAEGMVASALEKAEGAKGGRSVVSVRMPETSSLSSSTTGRLERRVERGETKTQVISPDGNTMPVDPRAVMGVPNGGRVVLVNDGRRLTVDTSRSDQVHSFVGKVESRAGQLHVVSTDPRAALKSVPLGGGAKADLIGKTVLVHVEDALTQKRSGELREVLDGKDPWRRAFTHLAVNMGVEATFSSAVTADVAKIQKTFNPDDIKGYTDLTSKYFFSIDNPYSKDFDQAMCIEPTPGKSGSYDVYYAIADLDYFLRLAGPDSALAQRAKRVQTTTYMPGLDFPVLPRELSEGLCSLNQGEKRPAFVIKFSVAANGEVGKPTFIDGVIKNEKNGNYPEAQAHLEGKKVSDAAYAKGIESLQVVGGRLIELAKARGMLTSDSGESWATIDPKTKKLTLEKRGSLWIEEANAQISITANSLIGKYLIENKAPAFHRRHDDPEPKRVERARLFARKLGVTWAPHEKPREVLERLDTATALGRAMRRAVLRAMPRAYVDAEIGTHFGLKLAEYVQSTAPMRRSRDAVNHASVRAVRDGKEPPVSDLSELVSYARGAEDRQRAVESQVKKHLAAEALSAFTGKTIAAEVLAVSPFGVDLHFPAIGVDAQIPFTDLPGGSYRLDDGARAAVSADGRAKLRIPDTIQVKVGDVDPFAARIKIDQVATPAAAALGKKLGEAAVRSLAEVRGDGFETSRVGEKVTTKGIVTAVNGVGFFIQPAGAKSSADAGGLLVRTRGADVEVGDLVEVTGVAAEKRNAEAIYDRSVVELVNAKVKQTGHDPTQLPAVFAIGADAASMPPADPKEATEYWRKLLGQRVSVPSGVVVSPSNRFGDLCVLPESWVIPGAVRTPEGGVVMPPGQWNHQALSLKFRDHVGGLGPTAVGSRVKDIEGVVIYRSGSFQIEMAKPAEIEAAPPREMAVTKLVGGPKAVTVASVNALNLHPGAPERAEGLAQRIVKSLRSPDVIAIQEIQDNDGPTKSGVTDASETFKMLVDQIEKAGGPKYRWFDIPPKDGADGGEPGGNIRNGYLYRADRVELVEGSVERIGDGDPAFDNSRKSLAARFAFGGREILVVNNHLASRRGSSPWTASLETPVIGRQDKREAQAKILRDYVDGKLAGKENVDALMVGDMNDWGESPTIGEMTKSGMVDLSQKLPIDKRFDYNYRGTLQVLQPPVGSAGLDGRAEVEVVHKSCFQPIEDSDHDPVVIRVKMA